MVKECGISFGGTEIFTVGGRSCTTLNILSSDVDWKQVNCLGYELCLSEAKFRVVKKIQLRSINQNRQPSY